MLVHIVLTPTVDLEMGIMSELPDLEQQKRAFESAGLDVDVSFFGLEPEEEERAWNPGRIRIKSRSDTSVWDKYAACRGMDTNLFYPTRSQSTADNNATKAICQGCSVRWACLAHAVVYWEKIGIWGGFTEIERREVRRDLQRSARAGLVNKKDEAEVIVWLRDRWSGWRGSLKRGTIGRVGQEDRETRSS